MIILIVNGSHRRGNTDIAIESIKDEILKNNSSVDILYLREIEMKLPDGCDICAESGICPNVIDEFSTKIEPAIRNYDAYIVATPIWSDGMTPLIKIFWDRIVSWCHKDRMYLKNRKVAMVVHGMADPNSWDLMVNWLKGVCTWEGARFCGSFKFKSGSKIGSAEIDKGKLKAFVANILA